MSGIDYDPKDIEDAIVTALTPLLTAGSIKTLESYAGQLDTNDVGRITYAFPALYVAWADAEHDVSVASGLVEARVTVLVCDGSLRGASASRRGAPESIGVYGLLNAVRGLLHRKYVVTGWGEPVWVGEAPIGIDDKAGIAVYAQNYKIVSEFED